MNTAPTPPGDHTDQDFIASLGPAFLAHMLRRISDQLVDADVAWHDEIGLVSPPRTSSTLLALDRFGPQSATQLGKRLNQSHQLVQQWIGALDKLGLVAIKRDPKDARRSLVRLTARGQIHVRKLEQTIAAANAATRRLLEEFTPDLEDQLRALDRELGRRDFVADIREAFRD